MEFQSTLPQGERRTFVSSFNINFLFQSTLPQGERHHEMAEAGRINNFNPRSHKGSDILLGLMDSSFVANFNPRSHKGSDYPFLDSYTAMYISIHAPTRGATAQEKGNILEGTIFQSTLPQGERQSNQSSLTQDTTFQSTLPQGERHKGFFVSA